MNNNKADILLIRKYLNGELDASAMYALERRAQDDPMLMDLMIGMEMGDRETDEAHLSEIDQLINARTQGARVRKIVPWKGWAVAASLLIAFPFTMLWVSRTPQRTEFTQRKPIFKKSAPAGITEPPVIDKVSADSVMAEFRNKPSLARLSRKTINPAVHKTPVQIDAVVRPVAAPVKSVVDSAMLASTNGSPKDETVDRGISLNEIQVVGYGIQHRKEVTSSATVVKDQSMIEGRLEGKVAGLSMSAAKMARGKANVEVKGLIVEKESGLPLPGVAVRVGNHGATVITGADGQFSMIVPSRDSILQVSYIGYTAEKVKVKGDKRLTIALRPANNALSEVVVVNTLGNVKITNPQPAIGWAAYKKYLKENARVTGQKAGRVTVAFRLDKEGSPVNLRIVGSSNDGLNQKAMELILSGSKWTTGQWSENKEVIVKIRFR